jgi:hypothetical protein
VPGTQRAGERPEEIRQLVVEGPQATSRQDPQREHRCCAPEDQQQDGGERAASGERGQQGENQPCRRAGHDDARHRNR